MQVLDILISMLEKKLTRTTQKPMTIDGNGKFTEMYKYNINNSTNNTLYRGTEYQV